MINKLEYIAAEFYDVKEKSIAPLVEYFTAPHKIQSGYNFDNIEIADFKYACMGAQWLDNNGKVIRLLDRGTRGIYTYPTKDLQLLVAVYAIKSKLFPYPNNIVVYNYDGSIRHIVESPFLETEFQFPYHPNSAKNIIHERGNCFYIEWVDSASYYGKEYGLIENDKYLLLHFSDVVAGGLSVKEIRLFDASEGKFIRTILSKHQVHER